MAKWLGKPKAPTNTPHEKTKMLVMWNRGGGRTGADGYGEGAAVVDGTISSKRNRSVCHSALSPHSYSLHIAIMLNRQKHLLSSPATRG